MASKATSQNFLRGLFHFLENEMTGWFLRCLGQDYNLISRNPRSQRLYKGVKARLFTINGVYSLASEIPRELHTYRWERRKAILGHTCS